ncbi:serum paraoxonase/arylesterase [Colletotrichum abscissum]|uniref:Serum paraoxonase/arylesterase n=1 Tax=Colletotrichum abscissum TaxID=1671311 RepID=A0A9Q0B1Z8_9PEZI|nr:serum paraoxonase/arylesterase [Colletotrichum abscissum]KAI3541730.1 serum paraoxonase/arylesterase [Colletotrichum abscissum]KAK1516240.1 serum paraoxonase/arylesterase [Colletotrichum abscissum]
MAALVPVLVAGLAIFGGFNYAPTVKRSIALAGIGREKLNTPVAQAGDLIYIDDTIHCEDIHYHEPSGLLFTACEDNEENRAKWFPGLGNLNDPLVGSKQKGSIHVIDPKDMTQKRLKFENFDSTYVTHGIDVITDPKRADAVYIFAVNHVPHPDYLATKIGSQDSQQVTQKSQSRVEIFHHILGSSTAKHLRTVIHPLIKTPNDIFIKDPYSFYVTNDHYYADGVGRHVEDIWPGTTWTDTIYVHIEEISSLVATEGIKAEVALSGIRNNNGLGHSRKTGEILVVNCAGGEMLIGELSSDPKNTTINIIESVQVDSYIDNPSYFDDPYKTDVFDASGFVLPGLTRPVDIPKQVHNTTSDIGSIVWYAKPAAGSNGGYEKRLVFEDDGTRARSAAAAVLVAIDPAQEKGERKAWLFVTGFMAGSVVAVKIDL